MILGFFVVQSYTGHPDFTSGQQGFKSPWGRHQCY